MDWFERITGFKEADYATTRGRLILEGGGLRSVATGRSRLVGDLELVSLTELRRRAGSTVDRTGQLSFRNICGDARAFHRDPALAGALFQVASQFNLLEMVGPQVSPEQGVTRYEYDLTQGPACAIAAGAATIYRNYLAPVGGGFGQTAARQFNGLADVGQALSLATGRPIEALWTMRNGYALCTPHGLAEIDGYLREASETERDAIRGALRIGLHRDVEVTDVDGPNAQIVSQALCSALPVSYAAVQPEASARFASLVLEAAYEATFLAAALNMSRNSGSPILLLTRLGGGVFGNDAGWIDRTIRTMTARFADVSLDVRLVSRRQSEVPSDMINLERQRLC